MCSFRTVRTPRLPASKKAFAVYGDAVEIIVMDDLIGGSYPDAFKGALGELRVQQIQSSNCCVDSVRCGCRHTRRCPARWQSRECQRGY